MPPPEISEIMPDHHNISNNATRTRKGQGHKQVVILFLSHIHDHYRTRLNTLAHNIQTKSCICRKKDLLPYIKHSFAEQVTALHRIVCNMINKNRGIDWDSRCLYHKSIKRIPHQVVVHGRFVHRTEVDLLPISKTSC